MGNMGLGPQQPSRDSLAGAAATQHQSRDHSNRAAAVGPELPASRAKAAATQSAAGPEWDSPARVGAGPGLEPVSRQPVGKEIVSGREGQRDCGRRPPRSNKFPPLGARPGRSNLYCLFKLFMILEDNSP